MEKVIGDGNGDGEMLMNINAAGFGFVAAY